MQQSPLQFRLLPEVIKNLLIINGLFFLASVVLSNVFGTNLIELLGVYLPQSEHFRPYQLVTHMFMHGNMGHIFFNMFALWMFGNALENVWGPKRFLIYYFVTGLGAAFLHLGIQYWEFTSLTSQLSENQILNIFSGQVFSNDPSEMIQAFRLLNNPTVGASGAVFGVLLAFGMLFPNQYIYIYFVLPVKVKYFVAIYGALELYNGIVNDPASNVAHFAHLGGMLFGFLLLRYWKKNTGTFY
tara:strand:- start:4922 stop:5647 length:726 start_codon:yes stop_codon:yes gene_type:complete